jgi:GT2 family glycosyltransferase
LSAKPAPRLDIVIVNWNTGPLLRACLRSIRMADRAGFQLTEIVVVDNASADESAHALEGTGAPLRLIRNSVNRGFAAACNQAARQSAADYLLFLNPDTRLTHNSLSVPLAFLEQPANQQVGIVGIKLLDNTSQVSRSCARFITPGMILRKMFGLERLFHPGLPSHFMTEWDHNDTREVDHVTGAFFLVRRGLFERLGGFDQRFFVYLEDLDFSLRAKQAGWKSVYLASSAAYHVGGASSDLIRAQRLFYALHSRILYVYKHCGWWVGTGLACATLLVEMFTRLGSALARVSAREMRDILGAYRMLWGAMPPTIGRSRSDSSS